MSGYTKLFSRILDSTIWREDDPTRILWITLLALADRDGEIHSTIPGLADRARISLKECEKGLERFHQPDKYSATPDFDGRRIETIDGGWRLLNHAKYRKLMSKEDQREKTRVRVANFRSRKKSVTPPVTQSNRSNDIAEAEAKADTKEGILPQRYTQEDFDQWDSRRLADARKKVLARIQSAVGSCDPVTETEFMTAVCEESGLLPARVRELEQKSKWASA